MLLRERQCAVHAGRRGLKGAERGPRDGTEAREGRAGSWIVETRERARAETEG